MEMITADHHLGQAVVAVEDMAKQVDDQIVVEEIKEAMDTGVLTTYFIANTAHNLAKQMSQSNSVATMEEIGPHKPIITPTEGTLPESLNGAIKVHALKLTIVHPSLHEAAFVVLQESVPVYTVNGKRSISMKMVDISLVILFPGALGQNARRRMMRGMKGEWTSMRNSSKSMRGITHLEMSIRLRKSLTLRMRCGRIEARVRCATGRDLL